MKNWVIGLLIFVASALLVLVIANQQTQEGSIVFEMKYMRLDGGKDVLRYNSYWGFGSGNKNDTPFITEVKKDVQEPALVYNPNFDNAQWSAVEVKDNEAVAFYFDLDANGKLSDNEKILPTSSEENPSVTTSEFVTPDLTINTKDGRQVPFRALLQVNFYQGSPRPNCMWSPSCVLEGISKINGKSTRLILFTNGFTGSFKEFGRCSYYLDSSRKQIGRQASTQPLSSIINYKGQFYQLKLDGSHEKDKTIRAVLEKYTGPTGQMTVKLSGNQDLISQITSASIIGSEDKTIFFNISGEQSKLPTRAYKLNRGYINYKTKDNDQWRLDFSEGPEFKITTGQISTVELGKPVLSISAIDESKRYQSDVKEQTVFSKGTKIFLSRKLRGMTGELYGRIWQKNSSIKPEIKIVGPDGEQVASAEMEYG